MLAPVLIGLGMAPAPAPSPFINKPGRVFPAGYPYYKKRKPSVAEYYEEEESELEEVLAMMGIEL